MNYSKYMDVQEEVKIIEKELVDLIIKHLKTNRIAVETARQQAKDFLALLPIEDQRDLLKKLRGLSEKYEEAKEVYAAELGKVNEAARQQTLNQMRMHIQAGNIEAAIAAAKAMYPEKHPTDGLDHSPQVLSAQQAQPVATSNVPTQPVAPVPQAVPAPQQEVSHPVQPQQVVSQPNQAQTVPQVANQPTQQAQQPVAEKGGQT